MELVERDDGDLLRRWTLGDRIAGDLLIARHGSVVLGVLRRQLSRDIDDTFQETVLALLGSGSRFRATSSFRSFAASTAFNQARAERRRRAKADSATLPFSDFERLAGFDSDSTISERRYLLLDAAIARLTPDRRQLLALSFWQGLTHAEIAAGLGVAVGTVSTRFRRTYIELKRSLGGEPLGDDGSPL